MSLDALHYATIPRAVELTREPSPRCHNCGHSDGWHTWQTRQIGVTGQGEHVRLVSTCQADKHGYTGVRCSCYREQALTP